MYGLTEIGCNITTYISIMQILEANQMGKYLGCKRKCKNISPELSSKPLQAPLLFHLPPSVGLQKGVFSAGTGSVGVRKGLFAVGMPPVALRRVEICPKVASVGLQRVEFCPKMASVALRRVEICPKVPFVALQRVFCPRILASVALREG